MSTLLLDIQATDSLTAEVCPVQCMFTRSDTNTAVSTSLKFTQSERVYDGPLSKVYRGTLTDDHGTCNRVVCKLVQLTHSGGNPKTVKHEADIYTNHLSQAQGICVPKFYGLFEGEVLDDTAACIILEDCGVAVTRDKLTADDSESLRKKLYSALMTIHKLGVSHGDFVVHNVMVDDLENPTRVNLIDFEHAKLHECDFCTELHLYTVIESYYDCRELLDAVESLELVTPSWFVHKGQFINLGIFKTVEELADVYHYGSFEGWDREEFVAGVSVSLDKHKAIWDDKLDYVNRKRVSILRPMV